MKRNCTHLIEEVCPVHCLKVDGFSVTKSTIRNEKDCRIKSRCSVDRYDWEIQFRLAPYKQSVDEYCVALVLVYLGAPCDDGVAVELNYCVDVWLIKAAIFFLHQQHHSRRRGL
jgi:hypothetical protein